VARMGEERKCTLFWWKRSKGRGHSEDWGVGGKMGSEWILGRLVGDVWSGFNWLRIEAGGGLLWIRWWTFGFWRQWFSYRCAYSIRWEWVELGYRAPLHSSISMFSDRGLKFKLSSVYGLRHEGVWGSGGEAIRIL
jgi:hypothetical protein